MKGFYVQVAYRDQMYVIRFMYYTDERYEKVVVDITLDLLVEMNNWITS